MRRTDTRQRFLIESCDVRGELVTLDAAWVEATARTDYPPSVARPLGQVFVAATLLAGTVKFDGRMTLQITGDGPLHLLVVQIDGHGSLRGLARWREAPAEGASLADTFGADARMSITIETRGSGGLEPYQGIVALEGDSLASALERYFRDSEQLPTMLRLSARDDVAAGLLLQRLPAAGEDGGDDAWPDPERDEREEGWRRATTLGGTVTDDELCERDAEALLHALFHEERVRVFEPADLRFRCACSRERTDAMLIGLGRAEVDDIVAERGAVEITCEFCDASYAYDPVDVAALFAGAAEAAPDPDAATHH